MPGHLPTGGRFRLFDHSLDGAALAAGGLIALGLSLFSLSRHASLYGLTEYDDGVYFASAVRLVNGHLPYRDFVIIQPPGITLLMSPLALFGAREGLALARILTALVASVNAVFAAVLVRHYGRIASVLAGIALAVFPPAFIAYRTLELEPYLVFFCLLGALFIFSKGQLASQRRLIAGGVMLGIAGTVKSFAIFAAIGLIVVIATRRRRQAMLFVLAVVAGFAIPCLPFFTAAPHGFVHDVFTSQLARQNLSRTSTTSRLGVLTGLADASRTLHVSTELVITTTIVLVLVLGVGTILPASRRGATAFEQFVALSMVLAIGAILIAPPFYNHYAYFSQVFIALGIGLSIERLVRWIRQSWHPERSRLRAESLRGVGAISVLAILFLVGVLIASESSFDASVMDKFGDPGPAIAKFVPSGACMLSDAVSLLVSANRLTSTDPNCPLLVDSTGTWIATDPNTPPLPCGCGPKNPALTAQWQTWFERSQYVIFAGKKAFRVPWTPALHAWFSTHYRAIPGSHFPVYKQVQ